ncbi:hypothetical protein C7N43_10260 [Sphingobacteriales bacterium UPWRP_1]|nr:hypothetical protein C7N43_10260 [Sphingobacteriales bacterium UPWRP_1]
MSITVVNIVSEQTIPNIVFVKEMPSANRYLFVTTQKMEEKGITDSIIKVCGIPLHQTTKLPVLENSFQNITHRLQELNLGKNPNEEYLINITGGTKPMSIVVHDFFRQFNSRIYYMPLNSNGFMLCNAEQQDETIMPVSCRLSLTEYLQGYGFEIANQTEMNRLTVLPEFTGLVFEEKLLNAPEIVLLKKYIETFTKEQHHQPGSISLANPPHELIALPNFLYYTIKFPVQDKNLLNNREIQYLTGGWFKEYLYLQLKSKYRLNDSNIGINVKLVKNNMAIEPHLIFTLQNSLYMGYTVIAPRKTELENTIYRLSGIKKGRNFGLQSKGFIAIAEIFRNKAGNIQFDLSNRAALQDVLLYDRLSLSQI